MSVYRRNEDGTYAPAEPIPYRGWKARLEQFAKRRGWRRFAAFLAARDERGLGR